MMVKHQKKSTITKSMKVMLCVSALAAVSAGVLFARRSTQVALCIAGLAVVIAGVFLVTYLVSFNRYQNAVKNIVYENYDAAGIPNGIYTGECDVGFIFAKAEVKVENGSIAEIELLEHQNDRGSAAEGIEMDIVAQQKVDVDVVAGATNSSKVIKKAVDNALSSGK